MQATAFNKFVQCVLASFFVGICCHEGSVAALLMCGLSTRLDGFYTADDWVLGFWKDQHVLIFTVSIWILVDIFGAQMLLGDAAVRLQIRMITLQSLQVKSWSH